MLAAARVRLVVLTLALLLVLPGNARCSRAWGDYLRVPGKCQELT
jgi:hypothetical protein